jgi:acyl-CoA thioesterase I
MIVGYYADSLGLSRPGHVALEERYIYLFEKWLRNNHDEEVFVINRARRAFTIDKLYEVYKEDQEYVTGKKDILIIHEGICDCAPRPVPLRMRNFISRLPAFLRSRIIGFLHTKRAWLLKNGFAHFLVGAKKYEQLLKDWLTAALHDFDRIYILSIAPTNDQIDHHSPGFQQSIGRYNDIIRKVIRELNTSKVFLIDVHAILLNSPHPFDEYVIKEDGHHITALTHRLIADHLIQKEKALRAHA